MTCSDRCSCFSSVNVSSDTDLPLRAPCPIESIEREPQQFAERHMAIIGDLDEFLNRLVCRFDVELLIATGAITPGFAARFFRCLRRLPAWKIIIFRDARDGFFWNWRLFLRLRCEDRRLFQIRKISTRVFMRHLPGRLVSRLRPLFLSYRHSHPSGAPRLRAPIPTR